MTARNDLRDSRRFVAVMTSLLREGRSVRFRAHGWSMFPAIRDGELITVSPLGGTPLRTGDIVLVRHRRGAVAHRVVALHISRGRVVRIIARGDAARTADAPITAERLLGRVVAVERSGTKVSRRVRESRILRGGSLSRALGHVLRAGHRVRTTIGKFAGPR